MEINGFIERIKGLSEDECYELIYNWLKANRAVVAESRESSSINTEDRLFVIDNLPAPQSSSIYEKAAIIIEVERGMFESFCLYSVATRYGNVPLLAVARCVLFGNDKLNDYDICYPELEKVNDVIAARLFHYRNWKKRR